MINFKNFAIILLVVGVGSYYVGRYLQTPQTKIEYVDREVVKKDVKTVIKEVTRPDGSKEVVTTIDDNSTEKKDLKKTIEIQQPKLYTVGLSAKFTSITSAPNYMLQVSKKVLGPIGVSLSASTDKQIGVGVTYEF